MISLKAFKPDDFDLMISWMDSEELLIQIAGPYFSYPLTPAQLQKYLADEHSVAYSLFDEETDTIFGHAEIILKEQHLCKLDKIIIGNKQYRGKGLGHQIMKELLKVSFGKYKAETVELYVYDWNTTAIKLYEKVGFLIDTSLELRTEVEGKIWKAIRMSIQKHQWPSVSLE